MYFYFYIYRTELLVEKSAFYKPLPLAQQWVHMAPAEVSGMSSYLLIVFYAMYTIWPEILKYNTLSFIDFREHFLNLIKQDNSLMQVLPIMHEESKMTNGLQVRPFLEIETNSFGWRDELPSANILCFYFSDSKGWTYTNKHTLFPPKPHLVCIRLSWINVSLLKFLLPFFHSCTSHWQKWQAQFEFIWLRFSILKNISVLVTQFFSDWFNVISGEILHMDAGRA